jgi:hypothetical protein
LTVGVLFFLAAGFVQLRAQSYPSTNPYVQPAPAYAPSGYGQASPYGQPQYQQSYPAQQQQGQPQQYDDQQGYGQQAYAPDYSNPPYPQQAQAPVQQPLSPDQLAQLVAPIALYPDTLVAQVLAAATYPAQVAAADGWRQSLGNAPPDQIIAGADVQGWDPSVKSLTAFPQVLSMMSHNLSWTTELGNAYYNQPQDVMQTIQVMRQRAQAAGTLQSNPWEQVSYQQGYIELAPVNPAVYYVPQYDPWTCYGAPVTPYSGFSFFGALGSIASIAGSAFLHYGPGIAMGAFTHTPWGILAWGLNWLTNELFFNHSNYYSHSTTVAHWNLPRRGGPYPERGFGGVPGERYNRFAGGENFANRGFERGTLPSRPMPMGRAPEPIAGNRAIVPARPELGGMDRNPVRPAFGNGSRPSEPPARPQAFAYNRAPEPVRQNFGSSAPARSGDSYGSRFGGGYASPTPAFRTPAAPQRNNFSEPSMNQGFGNQGFGNRAYGGARNSEMAYGGSKMAKGFGSEKMPKSFSQPKMKAPKAPHFSEHSSHGGGGHSSGGHHR